MEENYNVVEEWNFAKEYLKGINELRILCRYAVIEGRLDDYFKYLDRLFVEVSSKLKPKDEEKINESLNACSILAAKFRNPDKNMTPEETGSLRQTLRKIDIKIHSLIDEKGILTPKTEDARLAVLGGKNG